MRGPGSELARVLLADSLRGANWPGSEKAVNRPDNGMAPAIISPVRCLHIGVVTDCAVPSLVPLFYHVLV